MKLARIRQIEKLEKVLRMDGYEVKTFFSTNQRLLIIHIGLSPNEGEEIMAQWTDLKRVNGG